MTKIIEDREEQKDGGHRLSDDEIAYMGGGLLDAAVDTTWATIMSFIMFMATNPDSQTKAQEEIDRISRLQPPGGDLIDELPYLRACLLEVRTPLESPSSSPPHANEYF